MNHLLKDCMKECCNKEENVCDIIDGLGRVVEDINYGKKIYKELEKVKKELEEKSNKAIAEAKEEFTKLLKSVDSEKGMIGEYKGMPVGSLMPEGGFKINIGQGHTLVQGNEAGKSQGNIQKHFHTFLTNGRVGIAPPEKTKLIHPSSDASGEGYITMVHNFDDSVGIGGTDVAGGNDNLAAGTYAELGQYKGVKYTRRCMRKCLEKCVEDSLYKNDEYYGN